MIEHNLTPQLHKTLDQHLVLIRRVINKREEVIQVKRAPIKFETEAQNIVTSHHIYTVTMDQQIHMFLLMRLVQHYNQIHQYQPHYPPHHIHLLHQHLHQHQYLLHRIKRVILKVMSPQRKKKLTVKAILVQKRVVQKIQVIVRLQVHQTVEVAVVKIQTVNWVREVPLKEAIRKASVTVVEAKEVKMGEVIQFKTGKDNWENQLQKIWQHQVR
jgi:hypothetical protein